MFTTATESSPYTRRKGKEKMVESDSPKKKKLQEQIDVHVARELEEDVTPPKMRTRIAQSLVLSPVADEPTSPLGDDS
uniref:Uncharacterized protein n=1 Tax=Tanacetum cinerariifolium TaxID=118510 RepID=A0A699SWZ9_TANCI|nr:hypothetical protein [Tanacetum cinerariifolium]